MTETARIIAYLRSATALRYGPEYVVLDLADALERGEHLKKPEPSIPASEWIGHSNVGH